MSKVVCFRNGECEDIFQPAELEGNYFFHHRLPNIENPLIMNLNRIDRGEYSLFVLRNLDDLTSLSTDEIVSILKRLKQKGMSYI